MAESAYLRVSEDLDTIRRSLPPDAELGTTLARLLAACSGTLREAASAPGVTPGGEEGPTAGADPADRHEDTDAGSVDRRSGHDAGGIR